MNGGGLVLFVVLFYAGALRELSQFAAVDVDGDLAAKMADFLLAQKIVRHFSNILLKYFAVVRNITIFAIQY